MSLVRRDRRGFTLIEALVVVSIMAILATLVGPSVKRMVENQRVKSVNAQFVTDLQYARAEAAARNAYMRFTFRSNADMTCYTIYTYTSNTSSCDCRLDTPCTAAGLVEVKTVRLPTSGGVQIRPITGMPPEFAFDPIIGALYKIPTDFITPPLTQYVTRTRIDAERTLQTTIGLGGRPTVCAPTGSKMQETPC